jgi:hypothetical protein
MSEPVVNVTVQLPAPQHVVVEQDTPNNVSLVQPSQVNTVSSSTQTVDVQQLGIVGQTGATGPQGPPGTKFAEQYELTSVSSWNHAHDFDYYPVVRLVLPSGQEVETDIEYPDAHTVYISFPTPFTGTVILS